MGRIALISVVIIGVAVPLRAQTDGFGKATGEFTALASPEIAKGPVPRMPDGHPDLHGPWTWGGARKDIEAQGGLKKGELPLLPWAKALRDSRKEENEPYVWCAPLGITAKNPQPWDFIQSVTAKGPGTLYVVHENGSGGYLRHIFMDGRTHPEDLIPTWWGHSIGRWDGDTLVIDTVGYNDKSWLDARGTPHTDQLHSIERWTRTSYGTMTNDITLDDPLTFSRPVQLHFEAHAIPPGDELMEYICAEENSQYGAAGGLENPYKEKGFGLEVKPGEMIDAKPQEQK